MRKIDLHNPNPNGVPQSREVELQPHIDTLNEIYDRLERGNRVYVEITAGERKGAIAYIELDDRSCNRRPRIRHYSDTYRFGRNDDPDHGVAQLADDSINCILRWDGRRNRVKWATYKDTTYLRGYEGPTVWAKFDKKRAAEEVLGKTKVVDRYGRKLKKGDRVLYINARYGCAAQLDKGVITEIKAAVKLHSDSRYESIHVHINNDVGEHSEICSPELSIVRLPIQREKKK
jgi:uncharacterized Zn ribbon protein